MVRSLYGKLSAVLLALFCAIGVLYISLTIFSTRMYQQEVNQKLNRTLAKNLVADQLLSSRGEVSPYALKELFHVLMVVNPSIEMYLLDSSGGIQSFSAPPEKVKRAKVDLEPVERFLQEGSALPILGDDPRDLQRAKVFSAAPIPLHGDPTGYLYIVLGGEEYDSVADMLENSYILRLSVWTALAGLLFALLAGLLLFKVLTRRIRQLASSMDAFARSDLAVPLSLPAGGAMVSGDEIDRLQAAFSGMAQRILHQVGALKQTDSLRRELVANVSHDLRTPLAALHGYLETLLIKEGRLTPEEQRSFLDIALRQSERLRRLVEELFELAKLDGDQGRIHRETFSLPELVQDVSQKFRLAAEGNGVRLHTRVQDDFPFVQADIGLIERAFENLMQNALRFTPDGGSITLELFHDRSAVTVHVTDTGCGIPQADLPHIFDRFYRVSRERPVDGAGLGLAITKRIIELHEGTIEAASTPNAGTRITFRLPLILS